MVRLMYGVNRRMGSLYSFNGMTRAENRRVFLFSEGSAEDGERKEKRMEAYHAQPIEAVLTQLGCDKLQGLNAQQVLAHRAQYGANVLEEPQPPTLLKRLLLALKEPMSLLLLLALLLLLVVNGARLWSGGETEFAECIGVAVAIALSVGISVGMEGRSDKAFRALKKQGASVKVRVLREGSWVLIPQEELVVGDLMRVGTGDKLVADGRLVEAHGIEADESALTGESMPVAKSAEAVLPVETPPAERLTMLYAGSYLRAGTGLLAVSAVGMHTAFGHIAQALSNPEQTKTPLQEKLERLGKAISMAGILAAGVAFIIELGWMFSKGNIAWGGIGEAFISAIVLIVACVPEGLPTIVAMSLAINVVRMAKQQALVRKLVASETIGCVTFICTDKTGTLTENRMRVRALVDASGNLCTPQGVLAENICLNSTATLREDGKGFDGNATEGALLVAVKEAGIDPQAERTRAVIESVEPFSSEKKRMLTTLGGDSGKVLAKGSPEGILPLCALSEEQRKQAEEAQAVWQKKACRVLAFAHKESGAEAFTYDGFAAIADPVRLEVPEAIDACRDAGIDIMMLTGDNLLTATAIAHELKLLPEGKRAITAAELEALDDNAFAQALRSVRVIARSTPTVKQRVVQTLQKQGETIAVTGDGINDAPAIRSADVGIAMGITGTDVTKAASDILLLDDAFTTIVRAIRWGRGITDNFRRFLLFQLTVNVSSVLVVIITVLLGQEPPFSALELLWINLIMDGPPALCLGLEKMGKDLLKRAPVRRDAPLVSRSMACRMGVIGAFIALLSLAQLRWDFLGAGAAAPTAFFTLFVCCQLGNALASRLPDGGNPFRGLLENPALVVTLLLALVLHWCIVEYGGAAFNTEHLSALVWAKCLAVALCIPLAFAIAHAVRRMRRA